MHIMCSEKQLLVFCRNSFMHYNTLANLFISPKFPRFMTVGDGPWQRARPRLNVWRQTLPSVGTLTGRATFLDPETLRPLSEGADKRREGLLIGDWRSCNVAHEVGEVTSICGSQHVRGGKSLSTNSGNDNCLISLFTYHITHEYK